MTELGYLSNPLFLFVVRRCSEVPSQASGPRLRGLSDYIKPGLYCGGSFFV